MLEPKAYKFEINNKKNLYSIKSCLGGLIKNIKLNVSVSWSIHRLFRQKEEK